MGFLISHLSFGHLPKGKSLILKYLTQKSSKGTLCNRAPAGLQQKPIAKAIGFFNFTYLF